MLSAILIYIKGEGGTRITHRLGVPQPFHPALYSALIIVIKNVTVSQPIGISPTSLKLNSSFKSTLTQRHTYEYGQRRG